MRLGETILGLYSVLILGLACRQSIGQSLPSLDVTVIVHKPQETCYCQTRNRIPVHRKDGDLTSGNTPEECLDFCIWKLGRRHERRRLHAILREQARWMARGGPNATGVAGEVQKVLAMSEEDLRRELEKR